MLKNKFIHKFEKMLKEFIKFSKKLLSKKKISYKINYLI